MSGRRLKDTPRSVTAHAMAILGAFSHQRQVMGLQEISARTGLPTSTTHRLVTELVEWGALARSGEYRYQVGPLVLRLASSHRKSRHDTEPAE